MVVGLTVGGWFASVVISRLINGLIDYAKEHIEKWDDLKRLKRDLPRIQAVVEAVDQGLIGDDNPGLKDWMWQLRDVADMADDVMDEFEYNEAKEKAEALQTKENESNSNKTASVFKTHLDNYMKRKMGAGKSKAKKVFSSYRTFLGHALKEDPILKRLEEVLKAIDEVIVNVEAFFVLVKKSEINNENMVKCTLGDRGTGPILKDKTQVFGRDNEKEEIVNKLLNIDCKSTTTNFQILPILGDGGIGKTTLAQVVYTDERVMYHFELRMWVCISNTFDADLITKQLYEYVCNDNGNINNFSLVQENLAKKLKSKKFLIVFDDVWNDNNARGWEKLLGPLGSGDKGSMVLLTTRMESVVRKLEQDVIKQDCMDSIFVKGLGENDYWSLFSRCAFGGADPKYHNKLQDIGKDIVKKLEGSPLAAKTVGGVLCTWLNDEYWTTVLKSEIWSLKQEPNSIIPALRLSYQHLDSHLKPCFSFCSLFPQDHDFNKKDLVYMWMAVGLVPRNGYGNKRPEDVGSEYFDELVNKSLLEHRNTLKKGTEFYIMHDLLHDLAQFVSRDECFRYTGGDLASIPHTARHLNARVTNPSNFNISHLKYLRTLIVHFDQNDPESLHIVNGIIKGLKNLCILWLSTEDFCEFPDGVNNLLYLRYFYFCGRDNIIPKIIPNLYLLQKLSFGYKIKIPTYKPLSIPVPSYEPVKSYKPEKPCVEIGVGKLINLRNLSFPPFVRVKLVGVRRLMSLQDMGMSFYVEKESGCKINELKDMIELRNLSIERVGYVGSHEEAIQANLSNKVNLRKLCLNWGHNDSIGTDAMFEEELLDRLEPHSLLKNLEIVDHRGGRPPNWMRKLLNFQLVNIIFSNCWWKCLPSLEELPYLKSLVLTNMVALKKICHQCNSVPPVGNFQSLEVLSFANMPELEEWTLGKAEPSIWLPCLRELTISRCPKLGSFPPLPTSLEALSLEYVGLVALPKIWQDKNKAQSLPSLTRISIISCSKLVSLSEGIFEHPDHFTSLREFIIWSCEELMLLPEGEFSKFIALKKLIVQSCPQLQGQIMSEYFLPSSLESLSICSLSSLDSALPKALEYVDSIVSLSIEDCAITSLTPKGVLATWKNLRELELNGCMELASLESLLLLSINAVHIDRCPKLIAAIPSQSTLHNNLIENNEGDTLRQMNIVATRNWFSVCSGKALTFLDCLLGLCILLFSVLRMIFSKLNCPLSKIVSTPFFLEVTTEIPSFTLNELHIDNPLLLYVEPLRNLSSVQKLTIKDCSELRALPVQWLLQNNNSLQEIRLLKLSSLESLPLELESLSSLRKLTMHGASNLQSLPDLPPRLEKMIIGDTSEEFKTRCRLTSEDRPKLAGKLLIFQENYSDVETIDERPEALTNNAVGR